MLLQVRTYRSGEWKALILSSLLKIQIDQFYRFFFGSWFPSGCRVVVGIVVSHQFNGVTRRNVVKFHEVGNFWVGFHLPGSFPSPPPGRMISRGFPLSSFPRVSSVFGRVASLLVANEALSVPNVLPSFTGGEIDLVHVHSIGIRSRGSASWWNVAVSSSSEFPESYHVSVELPSLIEPLFPFPTGLSIREGGSSHHDGKLLGYSSLEGIH